MSASPTNAGARAGLRTGRWLAVLVPLVVLALAAWMHLCVAGARGTPASGPHWAVRDADEVVLALEPTESGLPLAPGHVLHVEADAGGEESLVALAFDVVPGARQSSYVDLRLPGQRIEHRVYVVPGEPLVAY